MFLTFKYPYKFKNIKNYVEPLAGNETAVGFDLASNAVRLRPYKNQEIVEKC